MSPIKIKDNSALPKECFSGIPRLTEKIADKTLEQLQGEGIFVFPRLIDEANGISKDQKVLQSSDNRYASGNIMGFLGLGDERLTIESRFSRGEQDLLFQYLLERVFEVPNVVDLETDANGRNKILNLLIFIFPHYLKTALRKGIYKTYIRNKYNDSNVRGSIDIPRHIAKNTPFVGKIAYSQREYSHDNFLTQLIRHTAEFIKQKPYGQKILEQVKDEVKAVIESTPHYKAGDRQRVMAINRTNVIRHAYYREYRELQRLCLLILGHQKHELGFGSKQIYGLLFDGAWLWEEYIDSVVGDIFHHPMNKVSKGAQKLFAHGVGTVYPDFISKNSHGRIIADAKYKPISNIGSGDYLQVLAYMFRFDAKTGMYLYPEANGLGDAVLYMNSGSTYENNVKPRDGVCVIKHGFKIPENVGDYKSFCLEMKKSEDLFRNGIISYMNIQK